GRSPFSRGMVRFRRPGNRFEACATCGPRSFRSCGGKIPMTIRTDRVRILAGLLPFAVVTVVVAFHAKSGAAQKAPTTTYYNHGHIYTNDPDCNRSSWEPFELRPISRSEEHTSELQSQ